MPEVVKDYSLTKIIAVKFGIPSLADDLELDETIEVDKEFNDEMINQGPVQEFTDVLPLEYADEFQWLDPELPSGNKFTTRGTFVDESGQIYTQSCHRVINLLQEGLL